MQKPITLIKEEFTENIVKIINESGLPLFVIEPIISQLLDEIRGTAERQAEADKAAYEKYLAEQAEKEGQLPETEPEQGE